MQTKNPLRISQEFLDLDDIISDLNSEAPSSQTLQQQPLANQANVGGETAVKAAGAVAIGKEKTQKTSQSATVNAQSKKELNTNALQAGGNKAAKHNKENDSTVMNRPAATQNTSTVMKTKYNTLTEAKEQALQHTGDTKVATNDKHEVASSLNGGNNRYGDSHIKSTVSSHMYDPAINIDSYDEENTQLRVGTTANQQNANLLQVQAPFYMKAGQTMSNDEDVESFQRKLDTMIVNFRSETMSEFIKTKKQVMQDQAQAIDAERRRCNTLLGVKQNEIEQLKESLASKTKLSEDLNTRCEAMAFWAGKAKMLLRIKLLQHSAFEGLKQNRDFQKHAKRVLTHKLRQYRESMKRKVFQGWGKQYKEWKIVKSREDFDKAVKLELQNICAQYNKEIESLRDKLNEAQMIVDSEHRNKAMMQENLKKAFMRGVCALNFEAMNILQPTDQNYQQQIEKEMEKQVINAMNSVAQQSPFTHNEPRITQYQQSTKDTPPLLSFHSVSDQLSPQDLIKEGAAEQSYQERKQNNGLNDNAHAVNPFVSITESLGDFRKVDSKDNMWKPAPIIGREITPSTTFTYSQPVATTKPQSSISSFLPSNHFNRLQTANNGVLAQQSNTDLQTVLNNMPTSSASIQSQNPSYGQMQLNPLNEDTSQRTLPGNPTVIQNSCSLPDFVSGGQPMTTSNEGGRTIFANTSNTTAHNQKSTSKINATTAASQKKQPTASSTMKKQTNGK